MSGLRVSLSAFVTLLLALPAAAQSFTPLTPTPEQLARCEAYPERGRESCRETFTIPSLVLPKAPEAFDPFGVAHMALYKPEGNGPFPAIILLHHCAGLGAHLIDWAKAALAQGYAVLVLDSFQQRYQGSTCNGGNRLPIIPMRTRDAFEALQHLASFAFIDKRRVAAIGFSQGGRVAFRLASPREARSFSPAGLRFAAVVSVYGRCVDPIRNIRFIMPDSDTPMLALMGEKDRDGDPAYCLPALEEVKARGIPVDWHVFPGLGHAWDQPNNSTARMVTQGSGTNLFFYSAEATEESRRRAFDFLAQQVKAK
jgi:dienelactone hydrolase